MTIKFKIVTPERILLEEEVDSVTLPTQTGEITILPNHIPLISNLVAGEIKFKKSGSETFFATSSGVIEMRSGNELIVLTETAELGHEIDLDRAEKAREKAVKMMSENYKDEKGFADAAASLEKHLARLKVARKHRSHTSRNLESGIMHE